MKTKRRKPLARYNFGGFNFGMSDAPDYLIKRGFAELIRNYRFTEYGPQNRLGWDHITDGFTSSDDRSWLSTRHLVGFVSADAGKIAVFEKAYCWDDDGDAEDFDGGGWTVADSGQDFVGGFYFSSVFYVFSAEKIYSVNISTGAKTEFLDFGDDIESDNDNVIQMFPRFGQIWAVSGINSFIFLSDTGVISVGAGSPITEEAISRTNAWQDIVFGKIDSVQKIQNAVEYKIDLRVVVNKQIKGAQNHCYLAAASTDFADDDDIYLFGTTVTNKINGTPANPTISLHNAAVAGNMYIEVTPTVDDAQYMWSVGDRAFINDTTNDETKRVTRIQDFGTYVRLYFGSDVLLNNYAVIGTVVTDKDLTKVIFDNNWISDYSASALAKKVWADLDTGLYDVETDPQNNPDKPGHIRLHNSEIYKESIAFRMNYTPFTDGWKEGNSSWFHVEKDQGEIVEVIETRAGLYVFKKDPGAIYLVSGAPGPNGSVGTTAINLINRGITALPGTIQATKDGVYFGSIDAGQFKLYLLPLATGEIEIIPELSDSFHPVFYKMNDSSYTQTFLSTIIHNDTYLLAATTWIPAIDNMLRGTAANAKSYICQAYYDGRKIRGRWAEWINSIEEEYIDATFGNWTHYSLNNGSAVVGWYDFNGKKYRAYITHEASGGSAGAQIYSIGRYGWDDDADQPKDKMLIEYEDGGENNVIATQPFYMRISTPKIEIPPFDLVNIRGLKLKSDISVGDIDIEVFKNFKDDAIVTKRIKGLRNESTDVGGTYGELLTVTRVKTMRNVILNYNCQYTKFKMLVKDAAAGTDENTVILSDVELEYSPKSSKGNVPEAEN